MTVSTAFLIVAIIAIIFLCFLLFLALFEPGLDYKVRTPSSSPLESEDFLRMLEALTDAKAHRETRVELLTNGEVYYEAELEAIARARHSVNLEAYIFKRGRLTERFLEALIERAREGVRVKMVLDSIGSFTSWESYFAELRKVGGEVAWYHPLKWQTIARVNNRTHRELIIVDGRTGFIGGSGFADHWLYGDEQNPRWRDSMFRVEGDAVLGLQATFAENWLEASGEILTGVEYFPELGVESDSVELIINSAPSAGRSTHARMLYQTLFAAAQKTVLVTTPYFLPDKSARAEMVRARRERDVKIKIIAPGDRSDHTLVRRSSRRLYGELLEAGAEIYEYEAAMMHAKTLVIDDLWSVVGSTNFDNRSFGLNDEVNLAARNHELATRLTEDFNRDLEACRRVSLEAWRKRPLFEQAHEQVGRLLERQQ